MGVITMSEKKLWKPTMTNLDGRLGQLVATQLRNTAPPDRTEMKKRADQLDKKLAREVHAKAI